MKQLLYRHLLLALCLLMSAAATAQLTYPIVETGVVDFYSNDAKISAPTSGKPFYGQDATYTGNTPSYTDNGDGTITDNVTGLMWQKDMGNKISYSDAITKAEQLTLGEYTDWRVPTIKELYSLILFTGQVAGETAIKMFIDTDYFTQPIGNTTIGEREIDAQTWSSTQYVGRTMNGDITVFGVNFVDGRIKGYPRYAPGSNNTTPKTMYFRMVRGNTSYAQNSFTNNNDGTVTDAATGLMWQQADDGNFYDWQQALNYAESLSLAGYTDWRLPNAKELQSLVDYSRSPQTTSSPAIDPVFSTTGITDPDGNTGQYPYFWSGTSHLDGVTPYKHAVYVAFGEAQGKMNNILMDVHGAGAQRSDPKSGTAANYPDFFGPQGDVRYVYNAVRCVRTAAIGNSINDTKGNSNIDFAPNPATNVLKFSGLMHDTQITVFDMLGKIVLHKQAAEQSLDVSMLKNGIYLIKFEDENGTATRRFVKQ